MSVKVCSGALPGKACAAVSVESSAMRSARICSMLIAYNVSGPMGWGLGSRGNGAFLKQSAANSSGVWFIIFYSDLLWGPLLFRKVRCWIKRYCFSKQWALQFPVTSFRENFWIFYSLLLELKSLQDSFGSRGSTGIVYTIAHVTRACLIKDREDKKREFYEFPGLPEKPPIGLSRS